MSPFIHSSFWSDPEIEAVSHEVKMAVLWLITNSQTSIVGLCRTTGRRFTFETGLPETVLNDACSRLPKMLFQSVEGIWIKNFIHHQFGRGEKLKRNHCFKAISSAFVQIKNAALRAQIVESYPELEGFEALGKPLPRGKEEKVTEGKVSVEGGQGETEVLDRAASLSQAKDRLGCPADFAGMCFDTWVGNGGKNASGILVPWLRYVTKRWSAERPEWEAGTHRNKPKARGSPQVDVKTAEFNAKPLSPEFHDWRQQKPEYREHEWKNVGDVPEYARSEFKQAKPNARLHAKT